jgi:ABC-type uncharacterized transport system permease subunit
MLAGDFGAVAVAHSTDSSVEGVALEHLAYASGIVAGETYIGSATSTMAPVAGSSVGVRRTG